MKKKTTNQQKDPNNPLLFQKEAIPESKTKQSVKQFLKGIKLPYYRKHHSRMKAM